MPVKEYEVIKNAWQYIRTNFTVYPNLKVYVLDDGKSEDAKKLAAEMG